jgi:hypothetical protein
MSSCDKAFPDLDPGNPVDKGAELIEPILIGSGPFT